MQSCVWAECHNDRPPIISNIRECLGTLLNYPLRLRSGCNVDELGPEVSDDGNIWGIVCLEDAQGVRQASGCFIQTPSSQMDSAQSLQCPGNVGRLRAMQTPLKILYCLEILEGDGMIAELDRQQGHVALDIDGLGILLAKASLYNLFCILQSQERFGITLSTLMLQP